MTPQELVRIKEWARQAGVFNSSPTWVQCGNTQVEADLKNAAGPGGGQIVMVWTSEGWKLHMYEIAW